MILKKLVRSKRAITPVISTLLLILLSVAGGLVLYSYTMGYLGSMTKSSTSTQGMLSLDSASAVAATNTVTAYIRNVGGISVVVSRAYVNGAMNSSAITLNPAGAISPGAISTVTIVASAAGLKSGTSATVNVVGADGTTLVFSVTPP